MSLKIGEIELKLEQYRRIAEELSAEIERKKYEIGDIFPVREKLAARFGVTKSTVNRAIDILIEKGFLAARRGAGTVVVSTSGQLETAYVAEKWLMPYIPSSTECRITPFTYEELFASRSSLRKLSAYDGILWSHPAEKHIPQILKINKERPGIIINRAVKEADFVSVFQEEVSKRLKAHADSIPYFLTSEERVSYIHDQRLEGFVDACRKHKRFYEQLKMPEKFAEKFKVLETEIDFSAPRPLLIFSDDWAHTGTVARWAHMHDLKWILKTLSMNMFSG
jgi:DNA-binding transcriptional regulator YhcF (GntR family)